jgi:hypothetical protein
MLEQIVFCIQISTLLSDNLILLRVLCASVVSCLFSGESFNELNRHNRKKRIAYTVKISQKSSTVTIRIPINVCRELQFRYSKRVAGAGAPCRAQSTQRHRCSCRRQLSSLFLSPFGNSFIGNSVKLRFVKCVIVHTLFVAPSAHLLGSQFPGALQLKSFSLTIGLRLYPTNCMDSRKNLRVLSVVFDQCLHIVVLPPPRLILRVQREIERPLWGNQSYTLILVNAYLVINIQVYRSD